MAIIVEEEKRGPGLLTIVVSIVMLGIIGVLAYSLFFSQAPSIQVTAPQELEITSNISKIDLNVSAVTDSSIFKSLKEYIGPPEVSTSSRSNPFEPF